MELDEILSDYTIKFNGRALELYTDCKEYLNIKIAFSSTAIPHLLGLDKMISVPTTRPKKLNKLIKDKKYTIDMVKRDVAYGDIKSRIDNYSFIEKVFTNYQYCSFIPNKTDPHRLGKVEVVLSENLSNKEMVILGLVATSQGYFTPATLHVRNIPNSFSTIKRYKIKNVVWLQ